MLEHFPWHEALWRQLAGRSRHAHAYLLSGPAGTGKRILAERLLRLLLCQQPTVDDACGQCKACRLMEAGSHPDCMRVEPEEVDKPIRVDQVREVVGFVSQTAQLSGRKVLLLEPAEAMNLNAANALLKSLEEPSGDTLILLLSHQPSRLLPTIKSRCVKLPCPLPDTAQAASWLAGRLPEVDDEALQQLLALSNGLPLAALRLYQDAGLEQRSLLVEGVKQLLKQQQTPSQLAEAWSAVPLLRIFDWFCEWSQGILRYQMTAQARYLGAQDMHKVVQYLAERASRDQVLAIQGWLLEQRQQVLAKANLNRVLLLESLLVRWARLLPVR